METLIVKLKQQTPLIHFQHDQYGATLRASEVKPKLDRFIITKVGNGNYDTGIEMLRRENPIVFLSKNDTSSFDYKMKIANANTDRGNEYMIASSINSENIEMLRSRGVQVISNTPYFAQESKNKSIINKKLRWDDIPKKGVFYDCNIIVTITVFNQNYRIANLLKQYIQDFFIVHNFGTRQSKGFGVYDVKSISYFDKSGEKIDVTLNSNIESILKDNFLFVYKKKTLPDFDSVFSIINNDYKLLKSGSNSPYRKSKLMLYFKKCDIRWEKKFLKYFFTDIYSNKNNDCYVLKCKEKNKPNYTSADDDLEYMYIRALLGLSEQYEFLLNNPPLDDPNNKLIIKIKSNSSSIQRFQSPLLFKFYNETIYLVGNEVNEQIKGAEFSFLVNIQGDKAYEDDLLGNTTLTVPVSFSLSNFIRYALDRSMNYEELKNKNT